MESLYPKYYYQIDGKEHWIEGHDYKIIHAYRDLPLHVKLDILNITQHELITWLELTRKNAIKRLKETLSKDYFFRDTGEPLEDDNAFSINLKWGVRTKSQWLDYARKQKLSSEDIDYIIEFFNGDADSIFTEKESN